MESGSLIFGGISPKQVPTRVPYVVTTIGKDIWVIVRNGTVQNVEAALTHLMKSNGNIDTRNSFGSSALHIAVWRNHLPIVRTLLAAGANPNARDGESGWSSLHRAFHFGHIAVAGALIEAGGSLILEDMKGRTPVDLVSGPLKQFLVSSSLSGGKEVFSWGNGSNYQLGIGSTGILRVPGRIDALQGLNVIAVAAGKFHSVALTARGEVFSWGFGRGGRLGHPDFDTHSGQVAVIVPRQIIHGFGFRGVSVIAVAKHHTVVATNGGEVYTWGSNREGRLGYTAVDTQLTPRRVNTLKFRVVAVAAANKHSAVLTETGEIYTWGCNTQGQLGYGTSNSISNYIPRVVECLKGRKLVGVSSAKHHTVVLGAEGEVLTWGYKMVNPRRVSIVRYMKKAGIQPLKFHISERLHVVAISAGMTHSLVLSDDGLVFYWFSADPVLRCHQLLSLAGYQAARVSSSKYQTAVATSAGDLYSWDGKNCTADTIPVPLRVHGIKHATQLSVGENHSVVVASLFIPAYSQSTALPRVTSAESLSRTDDEVKFFPQLEDDLLYLGSPKKCQLGMDGVLRPLPSLKDLCQRVAAQCIVEPKIALQMLEFADSLGADILRSQCEEFIAQNLDYILIMASVLFEHVRPSLLVRVEQALDARSMQPWSHRKLPTLSATLSVIIDSEVEEDGLGGTGYARGLTRDFSEVNESSYKRLSENFLQQTTGGVRAKLKQVRAARKKLQQIDALELKQGKGHILDKQQLQKLLTKRDLQQLLAELELGNDPQLSMKAQQQDKFTQAVDKSLRVGNNQKNSSSGSSKHQFLETRTKGQSSNESLQIWRTNADLCVRRTPADTKSSSYLFASQTKKLSRHRSIGMEPVSSPMATTNFVTISGFDSHPAGSLESNLLGHRVSDAPSKTWKGYTSLTAEIFPLPSKSVISSSVHPPVQPLIPRKTMALGKKVVKGGLSLFLSGALDEASKAEASCPPATPKVEGPAWGGVHLSKNSASLRAIQSQQKTEPNSVFTDAVRIGSGSQFSLKERSAPSSKQIAGNKKIRSKKSGRKSHVLDDPQTSNKRLPLSQFVRTSPVAETNICSSYSTFPENSPPPWAATTLSGASLSLRNIQLEQGQSKVHQQVTPSRGSPHQASSAGVPTFPASASSSEYMMNLVESPSRWYKPDLNSPSTLRCIQIEEKAMKELRELYENVQLAKSSGS